MTKRIAYIIVIVALGYISCKKVYNPQLVSVSTNFLVVDGPIVSGDSTFIRLSRTTSLSDTTRSKAELRALVSVESDQNTLYPLIDKGKGLYILGVTNFSAARKYRLNIKTSNGNIYQSDFVPMKATPPIDSIYIKQTDPKEITFYADTHDATNNTRYYRWDYKDTWAYVPIYHIIYQYKNGIISYVTPGTPEDVSVCYRSSNSNFLILGSTAKLTEDVMKQQQLFSITTASQKIAHVYTIQLRQYALTKEGFEYYQNLKKNTEQIGSIFDSQPSILTGNIHSITNPTETVVGFLSASTIANKQFNLLEKNNPITAYEVNIAGFFKVTRHAYPQPYYVDCTAGRDTTTTDARPWTLYTSPMFSPQADLSDLDPKLKASMVRAFTSGDSLLFDIEFARINTYYYAPKSCIDCRLRGGTNIRPAYFPRIQ
jgi:hypothetical protein